MIENFKPVDALTVEDLQAFPVWQYANREGQDETFVRPVKRVPVTTLSGRIVGSEVRLANGTRLWSLLGNVDAQNARFTEHFATLSILRDGKWFTLSRYHDFDYAESGPDALARILNLSVEEIFPIDYDIRAYAKGDEGALRGQFRREPRERLSRAQIIAMAVP